MVTIALPTAFSTRLLQELPPKTLPKAKIWPKIFVRSHQTTVPQVAQRRSGRGHLMQGCATRVPRAVSFLTGGDLGTGMVEREREGGHLFSVSVE